MQLQPARWDKTRLPLSDDDDDNIVPTSRPLSTSPSPDGSDTSNGTPRSLPPRMRLKGKRSPFAFRLIKQASATVSHSSSTAIADKELVPIPSPPWAKTKSLPQEDPPRAFPPPPPKTGQKRRYASDDSHDPNNAPGHRMDAERGREMSLDKRRKEDLEREKEIEKAWRTLPPLPPFRPEPRGYYRDLSYPSQTRTSGRLPGYPEHRSSSYSYAPPLRYLPPPSGLRSYEPRPSPTYRSGPPPFGKHYRPPPPGQQSHPRASSPQPYPLESYPPAAPRAYGTSAPPLQQVSPGPPSGQPPSTRDIPLPSNRDGSSTAQAGIPSSHSQHLPSSTTHSYFHKIKLSRPRSSRSSALASSSQRVGLQVQLPPQPQENQQQGQSYHSQTLYQQAAAARHAAYSSPNTVDSTTLTTHPVPYSIGVKAVSSTPGRLVGEYEQHPLRQQTSYLPISAVGGAQFVLKPPRVPKAKSSKVKFMVSMPPPAPVPLPSVPIRQFSDVVQANPDADVDKFVLEPLRFQTNPEAVSIDIKQEEENVTSSVAAINITDPTERSEDVAVPEDDELAMPLIDVAGQPNRHDVGGSTSILSLGSRTDFMGSETNTFAAPARPSREMKKYPCDVCGQIFTRSGDVKRHKQSRHRESSGCICPYCGRVLTRQDALQRHWDKYCRKKSKRMDRRRRFDPGVAVDRVFLHPTSGDSISDRKNKGKQKARAREDEDGDVEMFSESEAEIDELESEDPLDGYGSESGEARKKDQREARWGLRGEDEDEEIDELDESDDDERDGVKSDAEGVSINGDDYCTTSDEESVEAESEEEEMAGRDAEPPAAGAVTNSPHNLQEEGVPDADHDPLVVPPVPEFSRPGRFPPPLYPSISPKSPTNNVIADNHPSTSIDDSSRLANGRPVKPSPPISFVEFKPPPLSPPAGNARPGAETAVHQNGPAPMSAFTSTFQAQPARHKTRTDYHVQYSTPVLPPQQPTPAVSLADQWLAVATARGPPTASSSAQPTPGSSAPRSRRGPKPRRNDFDAVLDPSQTAAQGGQIRMRVLPQATYMPPVQPALAIMHEQPHVAKRKGKAAGGLVPEYGFVPREYVYRERV